MFAHPGVILADCPDSCKQRVPRPENRRQGLEKTCPPCIVRGMSKTAPKKHSVRIAGHPTSISLEPEFWQALCEIAARRSVPVNALLAEIDEGRRGNLSSAIRLFVLDSCRRGELHDGYGAVARACPGGRPAPC